MKKRTEKKYQEIRELSSIIGSILRNKLNKVHPGIKNNPILQGKRYTRHRKVANLIYTCCFYYSELIEKVPSLNYGDWINFSAEALCKYLNYKDQKSKIGVARILNKLSDLGLIEIKNGDNRQKKCQGYTKIWGKSKSFWSSGIKKPIKEYTQEEINFIKEMMEAA